MLFTFIKTKKMKDQLFHEFPKVSGEQWKQQIKTDLKGADYEKLLFNSTDGIEVKPFYTSEDIKGSIQMPPPKAWHICEKIYVTSAGEGNRKAREVLEKGAESLWFILSSEKISLNILFEGIGLEQVPVYLKLEFLSADYVEKLDQFLAGKKAEVYLQNDVIGNLARTGNFYFDLKRDFEVLKSVKETTHLKSFLSIDISLYQNSGANIPQQLGYALAHLKEYLGIMAQKGQKQSRLLPQFIIATGGNYFFEIAKIRALRQIYSGLVKEYALPENCFILAQPTKRDKTLYDYNVNLLRTTTQSMSAVLGGANAVTNLPYDLLFHKDSEFGERIARNQLLIMKNEAYLDKVVNPADGSYYIESLTTQFAEAGLEIFNKIEDQGGFLKLLLEGKIQKEIKRSAEKEQELFDSGELILIGTNKYANPQDKMNKELQYDPFASVVSANTFIEPIREKRLSERIEQQRLQQELTES